MNFMNYISEFKRRNVFKSALAYLAVAWVLLQVFSILLPMVDSPKWVLKTITIIMFIGFPCWLFFSWTYQITSDGLKKIESVNSDDLKSSRLIYGLFFLIVITPIAFFILKPSNKKVKSENFLRIIW